MDIAKSNNQINWKHLYWIIYLPNCWFIYHIFSIQFKYLQYLKQTGSYLLDFGIKSGSLKEFVFYRNILYLFYIPILITIGSASIALRRKIGSNQSAVLNILPKFVLSIILTTFTYAISLILINIYIIFTKSTGG
jgi:hypothetical protein